MEILDLSNNQIEILPKTFGKVETLRGLNLKNNRLREFPPCEHLKNLQVLDISNDKREENNNHIEKLPFSICNLIGLKALLMSKALYMNSDTRFDTEGTPGFSQLINLEVLDCSGNELEFVDKLKVDSCPNLKQINFSDNKITMLFLPVVQRQTLTHVIFSGNKELNRCAFFPHSTGLEYLDFSGCSIKNLSTVAGKQAKKVKQIFLHDNQLKHDKDTSKLVDSSDQKSMNKMRQKFPNAKIWTIKATNKNLDDGLEEMYRSFYSNITVTREIVGKKGETETIFTSLHKLESQKKED